MFTFRQSVIMNKFRCGRWVADIMFTVSTLGVCSTECLVSASTCDQPAQPAQPATPKRENSTMNDLSRSLDALASKWETMTLEERSSELNRLGSTLLQLEQAPVTKIPTRKGHLGAPVGPDQGTRPTKSGLSALERKRRNEQEVSEKTHLTPRTTVVPQIATLASRAKAARKNLVAIKPSDPKAIAVEHLRETRRLVEGKPLLPPPAEIPPTAPPATQPPSNWKPHSGG